MPPRSTTVMLILLATVGAGVLFTLPLIGGDTGQKNHRVDIQLENWQMSLLAQVQTRDGIKIKPFVTDGCSGGLSGSWKYMAEIYPVFAQTFGDTPPWQACCVEHDKAYWQGEIQNGFEKRLIADKQLEQCVIQFGQQHSQDYADKFALDKVTIETHFNIAASLMYGAVRVGGRPCSFLPWRWGYGWPNCLLESTRPL